MQADYDWIGRGINVLIGSAITGIVLGLFGIGCLFYVGCGDEGNQQTISNIVNEAPAAPNASADEDIPIGWEAQNLRIRSYVTTPTHIVAWISYEIDGTRSVSQKIWIEK